MFNTSSSSVGNEWMHHISLWLGLQPNCWDRSLAYFLLNDLEKACLYHETTWIIFCLCPISSSSLHTMRPMAVFPLRCQEWIYWLHQFLNLLLYSWKKTAFSMYGMKYRFWSLLWIITVWKCEYRSISDLLLIMHLFSFHFQQIPFPFVFIMFIIQSYCSWCGVNLLDVLTSIIEWLIYYVPLRHRPLKFFPMSNKSLQFFHVHLQEEHPTTWDHPD